MPASMSRLPSAEQPEPKSDVLRQARVARSFLDVGGLVDDHGRVARAYAVGGRARAVGGAHHRLAAGRQIEVRPRHQRLRHRNVDLREALQDVGGRSFALERLAHQPHGLERRLLRARMRREDDDVARLDRVDGVARGGEVGVRRRHDAGDDPAGLPYLTMPFSGSSSMTPTLFCRSASRSTPRIFMRLPIRLTASPSPLSSIPMSTSRVNVRLLATAQATAWHSRSTSRLIVRLDDRQRLPRAHEHRVELLLLLLGDAFLRFGCGHLESSSWVVCPACSHSARGR